LREHKGGDHHGIWRGPTAGTHPDPRARPGERGPALCGDLSLIETARDEAGRVYLKAWDEFDHHSVILREASTPGMDFFGFKVANETALDALARAPWP
jgi:hypothetical protein